MGDGCNDESSAYVGSTVCELSEGHAGPFIGKDNNKGGNEPSQGFLQGVGLSRLMVVASGNVFDRASFVV